MDDTCTLLLAGGRGERLFPLTRNRAKPSIPFGGIYSVIDFTLSNCLHSNLKNIHVLTQYASLPLERHIRSIWRAPIGSGGLYVELVPPQGILVDHWYLGTADAIYQNLFLIEQESAERVLILSGDHIYKMDYRKLIDFHEQNGADLSLVVLPLPAIQNGNYQYLQVDSYGRIVRVCNEDFLPENSTDYSRETVVYMGILCFRTKELFSLLTEDHSNETSSHDFAKDIIPMMISKGMRVFAYPFRDENKKEMMYWRNICSIDQYYNTNMELVDVDPLFNLYDPKWTIRTIPFDSLPPAKTVFDDDDRRGLVVDSLLSPGCIVSGGTVRKSVLSPRCFVHSWALVSHSILLKGVDVGRNAQIHKAIIEEGIRIPENTIIGFNEESDRQNYSVSKNGVVVVTNESLHPFT